MAKGDKRAELVVIGGGPGGYAAAFHAADLGIEVTLIDPEENPGGVCLYRGCIPSKALLHVARLLRETEEAADWGLSFDAPKIDLDRLRAWKEEVVARLTGGLGTLVQKRKVNHIKGKAVFKDARALAIQTNDGEKFELAFGDAIVATGSVPVRLPFAVEPKPYLWDSKTALDLPRVPEKLLVVGGGYIGLELGSVYAALGSAVTVVEMTDGLLPGADRDLVRPLAKRLERQLEDILLSTKVVGFSESGDKVRVQMESRGGDKNEREFDNVLVAIGRKPRTSEIGLEKAGVQLEDRGSVEVDARQRTTREHIYCIGDAAREPMLAHKATAEGRVAAEVIAGKNVAFDRRAIPAVVFTDPEVAWCGLTETEAKARGKQVKIAKFPWGASGRAVTMGRTEGLTKLLVDPESERILGMGIVGVSASELISEGVVALEMGALAADLELCIHPHPTLSETVMESAEAFYGHSTHIFRR